MYAFCKRIVSSGFVLVGSPGDSKSFLGFLNPLRSMDREQAPQHYAGLEIQPADFILKNGLPFHEGNIIKYIARWREKGGLADLEKAKSYLDDLIAHEKSKESTTLVHRPETYQDLERRPTPAYPKDLR